MNTLTIRFTGDSSGFDATINKINAELSAVEAKLVQQARTTQKTKDGFQSLQTLIYTTSSEYKNLSSSIRKASAEIINTGNSLDKVSVKQKDVNSAAKTSEETILSEARASAKLAKELANRVEYENRLTAAKLRRLSIPDEQQLKNDKNYLASKKVYADLEDIPNKTAYTTSTRAAKVDILDTKAEAAKQNLTNSALQNELSARLKSAQAIKAEEAAKKAKSLEDIKEAKALSQLELAELRLAKARLAANSTESSGNGLSVGHVLKSSAAYMAAAAAIMALVGVTKSVPDIGMKFQAAESGMLGVYKNQKLVNEQMVFLSKLADEVGVKVSTLRKTYTSFTASALKGGFDIPQAKEQYTNYIKTAKTLNLSDDDLQGMLTAIQQIISKGRIMSEELQGQLGEHIPAAVAIMAKSIKNADGTVGVSTMELRKMMEQGKLTSQQMQEFSDILFKEFSSGYSKSINNLQAETNRFSNAWDNLAENIFKKSENILASITKIGTKGIQWLADNTKSSTPSITNIKGKSVDAGSSGAVGDIFSVFSPRLSRLLNDLDRLPEVFAFLDKQISESSLAAEPYISLDKFYKDLPKLNQALQAANEILKNGSEEQKTALQSELGDTLQYYVTKTQEAYKAVIHYQELIAKKRDNGLSAEDDKRTLADQLEIYNTLTAKVTEISTIYNKNYAQVNESRDKAAEAIKKEADEAKKAIAIQEREAALQKTISDAKDEFTKSAQRAIQAVQKEQDTHKKLVETVVKTKIALTENSSALVYLESRLNNAGDAEARLAAKMEATNGLITERNSIKQERESLSGGIKDTLVAKFSAQGVFGLDTTFNNIKKSVDDLVNAQKDYTNQLEALNDKQNTVFTTASDRIKSNTESYIEQEGAVKSLSTSIVSLNNLAGQKTKYDTSKYDDLVKKYSSARGLDTNLVRSVIVQESRQNANAQSHKGAGGLMQVMPDTARGLGFSPQDAYNPEKAIDMGTKLLNQLSKKFKGDIEKILAAYNAGEGAVTKYGGVPPYKETRDYVAQIINYKRQFDAVSKSSVVSEEQLSKSAQNTATAHKEVAIGVDNILKKYGATTTIAETNADKMGEGAKDFVKTQATANGILNNTAEKQKLISEAMAALNAQGLKYNGTVEDTINLEEIVAGIIKDKQELETQKLLKASKERIDQATMTGDAYRQQELTLLQISDIQKEIALSSERSATFAEETKNLNNELLRGTTKDIKSLYKQDVKDKVLSDPEKEILATQKLNNEKTILLDGLKKEYDLVGLTVEAQERKNLKLQGYVGILQEEIIASKQKLELAKLELELDDLKYKNSHTDKENYRYDLRDKNIPEGDKDRIAQKYIDAQGAGILKSLTDESKELSMTAAGWEIAHIKMQGYSLGLENAIIAQTKLNRELSVVRELGQGVADVFEGTITDALMSTLETGNKTIDALISKLLEAMIKSESMSSFLDGLGMKFANFASGGGGGFFSNILSSIGSFLGFSQGAAFNQNGAIEAYATGQKFHNSIVSEPTFFKNGNNLAVAGEAGAEGIFPLSNGKVKARSPDGTISLLDITRIEGDLGVVLNKQAQPFAVGGVFDAPSAVAQLPANRPVQQSVTTQQAPITVNIINKAEPVKATTQKTVGRDGGTEITILLEKIDAYIANGIQKGNSNTYEALSAKLGNR